MKKFVITVAALVVLYIGWDFAYYRLGWYVNLHSGQEVSAWMEVRGDQIYRRTKDGMEPFEIRGMYMEPGIPESGSPTFPLIRKLIFDGLSIFRQQVRM